MFKRILMFRPICLYLCYLNSSGLHYARGSVLLNWTLVPHCRPQGLARSERPPIDSWVVCRKCPVYGRCLEGCGCVVMTHTGSCRFSTHPALPLIWNRWQGSALSCSYDVGSNGWGTSLRLKSLIHWAKWASGCGFPRWQRLVVSILKGCFTLCW